MLCVYCNRNNFNLPFVSPSQDPPGCDSFYTSTSYIFTFHSIWAKFRHSVKKRRQIDQKRMFSADFWHLHRADHVGVYARETSGERRLGDLVLYSIIIIDFVMGKRLKIVWKCAFQRVYGLCMLCRPCRGACLRKLGWVEARFTRKKWEKLKDTWECSESCKCPK